MFVSVNPSGSRMSFTNIIAVAALAAFTLSPLAAAHSWIEEYQVIDTNGTYIGDRGYSRGYMARTDPGYNGFSMDYLVPQQGVRINSSDLLCHPSQQTSNYSNTAYPKLQVQPGGYVAMKYLENGHVTLPWNQLGKPETAGTAFVYGTTQPSDSEKIADVLAWTTDGKGGNGKGFLMTAQNFDDGRCHQINCGNISVDRQTLFPAHVAGQPTSNVEQWCETDLQIPASQPVGTLTTYWVWQWPTAPNHDCTYPDGKDEYYTTCADFDIVSPGSGNGDAKIAVEAATNTLVQENPQTTAVSDFMSRTAYTTSPPVIMMSGTQTEGQSVTATSGFMSACSAGQTAGPKVEVPAVCSPVSIFTGAASASAAAALKEFATTAEVTAPAATSSVPVPTSTLATTSTIALTSVPTTTSAPAITSTSAPASTAAPADQSVVPAEASTALQSSSYAAGTIMSTLVLTSIVTETTYATASGTEPAAGIQSASGIAFSTLSTVAVSGELTSAAALSSSTLMPTATTSAASSASSSAPGTPTVGANGMVGDVYVPTGTGNRVASEHVARHANRRHARHFTT